jgi:hypothetical protein
MLLIKYKERDREGTKVRKLPSFTVYMYDLFNITGVYLMPFQYMKVTEFKLKQCLPEVYSHGPTSSDFEDALCL